MFSRTSWVCRTHQPLSSEKMIQRYDNAPMSAKMKMADPSAIHTFRSKEEFIFVSPDHLSSLVL
jgi:hypothetical protein